MVFFLYWQFSGQFRRLLSLFNEDFRLMAGAERLRKCDRRVVLFYVFTCVLRTILVDVVVTVYTFVAFDTDDKAYNDDSGSANELNGMYSAFLILNPFETYFICAGDVIMCFQVVTTLSLRSAFADFNDAVKRVSIEQPSDDTPKKLRMVVQTHVRLMGLLKTVDDILGLHTLIWLALAVPNTIYAVQEIEQVLDAPFRVQWPSIARVVSNMIDSLTDLVAIAVIPATVASVMSKTEKLLCRSAPIWDSRDEELDRAVTLFLLQLRQSGRGLSAGGLVTITNRLIITIGSLVVTYLTIIRRLEASNGGYSRAVNVTAP